jgi:predicted DNA-binding protein (UPF0251 family)
MGGVYIGLCRVDLDEGHRKYEVKYALNDKEGVSALLRDIHRLRERRFHAGDYSASDILIDLQTAIDRAGLTKRQREAIYCVYEMDLTQKDAGERMGIGQDVVSGHVSAACEKIATIYADWDYGEIILSEEESLDEI